MTTLGFGVGTLGSRMTRGFFGSRGFSSSASALRFREAEVAVVEVSAAVLEVLRALSVVSFFTEDLGAVLVAVSVSIFFGRPRPEVPVALVSALGAAALALAAGVALALAAVVVDDLGAEVVAFAEVLGAEALVEEGFAVVDFFGGIVIGMLGGREKELEGGWGEDEEWK